LVTGVVGGLINSYLPARGDFDRWAADPERGGRLDLGDLDLIQKRNHILTLALDNLPEASDRLLSALSLLPDAVDHHILDALNPHRPSKAESEQPADPESHRNWEHHPPAEQARLRAEYRRSMNDWLAHQQRPAQWQNSRPAAEALSETVADLERRGLLQYDRNAKQWDLHPVVRATARARVTGANRDRLGQQIIDHFSQKSPNSFDEVQRFDELHDIITVIQTMIQIERFDQAESLLDAVADVMLIRLEAYPEFITLARPMFASDWSGLVEGVAFPIPLASFAAFALGSVGLDEEARRLTRFILDESLRVGRYSGISGTLSGLGVFNGKLRRPKESERCHAVAVELAEVLPTTEDLLLARTNQLALLGLLGRWREAEKLWALIEPMDRNAHIRNIRPGTPEVVRCRYVLFPQGRLTDTVLSRYENLVPGDRNRLGRRQLHALRGRWRLQRNEMTMAVEALQHAVQMANESGFPDIESEIYLAFARLVLRPDDRAGAYDVARRHSAASNPQHQALAELWQALGEASHAAVHARAAYTLAWAEGEPYVLRPALIRAETLLRDLGSEVPTLPPYDPADHPAEDWEPSVAAVIAKLRERGDDR
jgi:hypothetical protein